MTETRARPDRIPILFIVVFAIAWSALVFWYVAFAGAQSMPSTPQQRLWAAPPLVVVGAVICALGYMSLLKRRAMRGTRQSLDRLLEQSRQKHL